VTIVWAASLPWVLRHRGLVEGCAPVARFSVARDGCRTRMVLFGALRTRGVRNNVTKARKLRELMARPGPIVIIGAHNGLSGKIGEEAGFDGLWASGFEISASYAVPDANILTMAESLSAAKMMNDSALPVVADCDNGFG